MNGNLGAILRYRQLVRFALDESETPPKLNGAGVCVIGLESNDFAVVEPVEAIAADNVGAVAAKLLKLREKQTQAGHTWIAILVSVPSHAQRIAVCEQITRLCKEPD
jgi:hypothetical protein